MKIRKKITLAAISAGLVAFNLAGVASAHVVVKPSDVKTAAYQTFALSVPVEKNSPTVSIRLEVPMGLTYVTPTVKQGWSIKTEKHSENKDEDAMISAITWTGGKIDVGYRDEFTFSAKTPDKPTDLQWKAYQTYADGTIVSWNQTPTGNNEEEGAPTGPFSVTKVAAESDQDKALKDSNTKAQNAQNAADRAMYIGIGGIILTLIAVAILAIRKHKTTSLD